MIYIILITYFISTVLIVEVLNFEKSIYNFALILLSTVIWGYLAQIQIM